MFQIKLNSLFRPIIYRYLEIEGREVPCTEELLYMDPKKAVDMADENTIGICAILGSTVSTIRLFF